MSINTCFLLDPGWLSHGNMQWSKANAALVTVRPPKTSWLKWSLWRLSCWCFTVFFLWQDFHKCSYLHTYIHRYDIYCISTYIYNMYMYYIYLHYMYAYITNHFLVLRVLFQALFQHPIWYDTRWLLRSLDKCGRWDGSGDWRVWGESWYFLETTVGGRNPAPVDRQFIVFHNLQDFIFNPRSYRISSINSSFRSSWKSTNQARWLSTFQQFAHQL